MPDFVLAAAGAIVFALTAWASLAFGYQVFQNMWETDQADGAAPAPVPTDDLPIPRLAVVANDGEVAQPSESVPAAAPTA